MTDQFTTEIVGADQLPALAERLRALAAESADDNAYYAPHYLSALIATVAKTSAVSFVTCWRGDALIGFLPVTRPKRRLPGASPAGSALQTLYNYSCTPLLHREYTDQAANTIIDGLSHLNPGVWTIPTLKRDSATAQALAQALAQKQKPLAWIERFARAELVRGDSYQAHLERHVAKDLLKNLARRRRRLEEQGKVTHRFHESGAGLAQAVEDFLAIEASGWKGKRGTAMQATPITQDLARRAFNSEGAGNVRADLLYLDDRAIAAVMTIFSGGTGFTVKMAYDDAYAKYSASRLLELEILRDFLESGRVNTLDSSTDGKHMIDDFWPGRTEMGTLVFSLAQSGARQQLTRHVAFNAAKSLIKRKAKALLGRS